MNHDNGKKCEVVVRYDHIPGHSHNDGEDCEDDVFPIGFMVYWEDENNEYPNIGDWVEV